MFCYQCEQTGKDGGCTNVSVCGKQPDVAALQDLLVYALEELAYYAVEGRKAGISDKDVNLLTIEGLFHTLTNVDFDPARLKEMIERTVAARKALIDKIKAEADHSDTPETIGVEQPGKYHIDLKGLLEKEPIVIQKDGTYTIHLPSLFKMREEKKK